jgi:tetratricopeptide (TPR) repeat protein
MYKVLISIFFLFLLFPLNTNASEDSISQFTYGYLKRVNDFLSEGDYENAEKELSIISKRYFLNENSYERSLINQLWGNLYATQTKYEEAIDAYEASLRFRKIPLITNLQVRTNLAQCYFQVKNFKKVIDVLLVYKEEAEKRGQEFSPKNRILIGISYYYLENFEEAYKFISSANELSLKYKEDWLRYELALAVKLNKIQEAIEIGQLLIYVNPEKKEYWQQVSGLYYTQNKDDESLAGLELAFDNKLLEKDKEYLDLARYYLYKGLPQKAVNVLKYGFDNDFLDISKNNFELLADSYFIARDRENGIKALQKSLSLEADSDIAFKIARFGFEDESWELAFKYFSESKKMGWNKSPGRLELLMGITQYELGNLEQSLELFNLALQEEDTKIAAEGWVSFVEEIIKNT